MKRKFKTMDANEAVANVAYRVNEVIAIYPITPSSPMGEWADQWASESVPNVWGSVPHVVEMQSEGGAAGAVHGALQTGSLSTTFTASQGLLLMIPNMNKIAGELTPAAFHVTARTLATHALSIFGDHSDVMFCRTTGWAMLCSNSVQEAMDLALIAHAASLETRIPFLHFFDGFRTSHEVNKIEMLNEDDMRAMINMDRVIEHRQRALSPDHPVLRGTAQNPDVFFQIRETANPYYDAAPGQGAGDDGQVRRSRRALLSPVRLRRRSRCRARHRDDGLRRGSRARNRRISERPRRKSRPAESSPVSSVLREVVHGSPPRNRSPDCRSRSHQRIRRDRRAAVPGCRQRAARRSASSVTDSVKNAPAVVGGRYGLSSKEFTPAMVKAVYDNLKQTRADSRKITSPSAFRTTSATPASTTMPHSPPNPTAWSARLFYGLGADGTVGANKNSIKIIGENTDNYAQGYFVYDSKKSGAMTVSHLRFGPQPIHSSYLVSKANFIACHQWIFLERYDMLSALVPGGVFLLNSPFGKDEVWDHLPREVQAATDRQESEALRDRRLPSRARHRHGLAHEHHHAGLLLRHLEGAAARRSHRSHPRIDSRHLRQEGRRSRPEEHAGGGRNPGSPVRSEDSRQRSPARPKCLPRFPGAPKFERDVLGTIYAGRGDELPVSAFSCDGTFPTGTAKWEKRNLALEIPAWDSKICIQCGKCAMVCPHAVIRIKVYDSKELEGAPATFKSCDARDKEWAGHEVHDPGRARRLHRLRHLRRCLPGQEQERSAAEGHQHGAAASAARSRERELGLLPEDSGTRSPQDQSRDHPPAAGAGAAVRILRRLLRMRRDSLSEAGFAALRRSRGRRQCHRLLVDLRRQSADHSLGQERRRPRPGLVEFAVRRQRRIRTRLPRLHRQADRIRPRVAAPAGGKRRRRTRHRHPHREAERRSRHLRTAPARRPSERKAGRRSIRADAKQLLSVADMLVKKSVWIVGGDGWAYDIGYGGLDHVLASGRNVNMLVLDTEVYSNTGGQASKSTPRGAVAKFAAGGKPGPKKDLGLMAMTYGNVYVASVAMGAKDEHTLKAFLEAEAYDGPSIIIAYSHCIAHGIDMTTAMTDQKVAVESGQWLLYRYNPERAAAGENPLVLDSRTPTRKVQDYLLQQTRFKMLTKSKPEDAKRLWKQAQHDVETRYRMYEYMASRKTEAPAAAKDARRKTSDGCRRSRSRQAATAL